MIVTVSILALLLIAIAAVAIVARRLCCSWFCRPSFIQLCARSGISLFIRPASQACGEARVYSPDDDKKGYVSWCP
jgi:hypothetical protein